MPPMNVLNHHACFPFFTVKYFVLVQAGTCLTSGMCKDYFCFIMTLDRDIQTVLGSHTGTSYPQ